MEPQKYSTLQLIALIGMQSIAVERPNRTALVLLHLRKFLTVPRMISCRPRHKRDITCPGNLCQ